MLLLQTKQEFGAPEKHAAADKTFAGPLLGHCALMVNPMD